MLIYTKIPGAVVTGGTNGPSELQAAYAQQGGKAESLILNAPQDRYRISA